jgi:NADH/F420H2 dehydrogenase subunit C
MNKNRILVIENLKNIAKIFPVKKIQLYNSEITVAVQTNNLLDILLFFKSHMLCQFKVLSCISCVDYPMNKYRFKLVYELLSIRYNSRIRIKIFTHELLSVDSCDKLFSAANWYECEIWDLFGVFFKNHSNLKRVLTDYGFEGYPLRKDFPLSGFIEMRYNETKKRVVSESIELSQEYRSFKFLSPWEVEKV